MIKHKEFEKSGEDELKFEGIFTEGFREIITLTIIVFIALLYHNI